uniref:WxxW domain-containing protein n=1 Tax=Anabas testudineus TaxID=64144 RepID=A0A3Q1H2G7_ANATE
QVESNTANNDCWTDWFDRDIPSGQGVWEILSALENENPAKVCNNPLQIEVLTKSRLSLFSICRDDTTTRVICKNSEQRQHQQIRFMCPTDFCSQKVCWTKWLDQDKPSGIGDLELLSNLRKENPGEICESPLYIDAVTSDTNNPVTSTGQSIFVPTKGFVCRNRDQRGQWCHNYKVRFGCPCSYNVV